jgi:hypothetical protein
VPGQMPGARLEAFNAALDQRRSRPHMLYFYPIAILHWGCCDEEHAALTNWQMPQPGLLRGSALGGALWWCCKRG